MCFANFGNILYLMEHKINKIKKNEYGPPTSLEIWFLKRQINCNIYYYTRIRIAFCVSDLKGCKVQGNMREAKIKTKCKNKNELNFFYFIFLKCSGESKKMEDDDEDE